MPFPVDLAGIVDIAPWILFFGLMLMFSAPVVRTHPKSHAIIDATPQEIWPLLQPDGWALFAHWKRYENLRLIDPERRVWSYVEHAPLRRPCARTIAQDVREEFSRVVETTIARHGKEVATRDLASRTVTLTPVEGGTRVEIDLDAPRLNLGAYWITRHAQERRLLAMRSYLMANKPEPARRHLEWRGVPWLLVLLAPFVLKALFSADLAGPAVVAFSIIAAALLRETGHAIASLMLGRRKIVISLSPLTGAATMRARQFRSKLETAIVSLSGPAFAAATALTMTPAIDRVARSVGGANGETFGVMPSAVSFGDKVDFACTTLATVVLVLNLLALIPIRSSLGAIIVQSVARNTATRIALVAVDVTAATIAFPGVSADMWTAIIVGALPPLILWLILWNVSGDADGFAPLPRRQAARLAFAFAAVFLVYGVVKAPLNRPLEAVTRATAQAPNEDLLMIGRRRIEHDI